MAQARWLFFDNQPHHEVSSQIAEIVPLSYVGAMPWHNITWLCMHFFFEVTRWNVKGVYIVNIFTLLSKYLCIAAFEKFGNKKDTCQHLKLPW